MANAEDDTIPPTEWLPGPDPAEGDEYDRNMRAALAARDAGRALFAWERWLRRYNELAVEAAPVTVQDSTRCCAAGLGRTDPAAGTDRPILSAAARTVVGRGARTQGAASHAASQAAPGGRRAAADRARARRRRGAAGPMRAHPRPHPSPGAPNAPPPAGRA